MKQYCPVGRDSGAASFMICNSHIIKFYYSTNKNRVTSCSGNSPSCTIMVLLCKWLAHYINVRVLTCLTILYIFIIRLFVFIISSDDIYPFSTLLRMRGYIVNSWSRTWPPSPPFRSVWVHPRFSVAFGLHDL